MATNGFRKYYDELLKRINALERRVSSAVTGAGMTQLTGDVAAGPGTGSQAATLAASGVAAGTYGDATHVPRVTVDAKGRVTAASDVVITGAGISELTGDVTAGPGSGSQVATIGNDKVTFAKMQNIATDSLIGRDAAGTGDPESILLNATLSMDGSGNLQRAGLTGDVTASAGSNATTIANDAVTNAQAANMAQATIKGRAAAAGTGDPTDLTPNQASSVLDAATDPFLRTSSAAAGGITQLTGDVTAGPGSGSQVATLGNDKVTNAILANMAQSTLKGRATGAGTGDPTDLTPDQVSTLLNLATDPYVLVSQVPGGLESAFWTGSIRRGVDSAGRNSSNTGTTFTDDGVLQFDLDANVPYTFDLWLVYSSPVGGGAPDFKFKLTGPATLTGNYTDLFYLGTGDINGVVGPNSLNSTGAVGTATTQRVYAARGWVVSTAGGTGASGFRLQWAQNNLSADDVILHAGSLLQYKKLV